MSTRPAPRPVRTPGLSAKEEIMARLRAALDVPRRDAVTEADDVPRDYQRADDRQEVSTDPAKVRDVLAQRIADYRATVHRTTPSQLPAAIAEALDGAGSVIVPPGVPEGWTAQVAATVQVDDGTPGPRELDVIDAVLTGCHTAIAVTGTLVLRSDDLSGRRALTLVPDRHVVVVQADQVVLGVPKGIERMGEDPASPWTLISGPSATSDIELERVEGVHGPRQLHVVLVDPEPEPEPEPGSAAPDGAAPSAPTSQETSR
ncbi:LUD domain-containing protein [Brachybacterium sp. NBEC-018]|uniref:LutC/YkgG family protein n=1 Tax=Brachybacterium sp. NBEC-018 TaxID=2996004 RepID=UPI0021753627|nr:LUD domain-containing protein [Brachybacterium sp. NBEC-018]UVY83254.1 LUD domain-containing protein [Brachybacterium sp. NBEC-018]